MLTLLTTEEFADWFRDLPDQQAEEAATALELLERLGPDKPAPHSRDLLLWYQAEPSAPDDPLDRFVDHAQSVRRWVAHLQSARVQGQLKKLGLGSAEQAAAAISSIRANVGQLRRALLLRDKPGNAWVLEEIERNYRLALAAAALTPPAPQSNSPALRELNLIERAPGARILYGVDGPHQRALLILGEDLNRRAFGPSVRRALRIWADFLAEPATDQQPFETRSRP